MRNVVDDLRDFDSPQIASMVLQIGIRGRRCPISAALDR